MIMDKKGKDAGSWLHLRRIIPIVIIINIIVLTSNVKTVFGHQ